MEGKKKLIPIGIVFIFLVGCVVFVVSPRYEIGRHRSTWNSRLAKYQKEHLSFDAFKMVYGHELSGGFTQYDTNKSMGFDIFETRWGLTQGVIDIKVQCDAGGMIESWSIVEDRQSSTAI